MKVLRLIIIISNIVLLFTASLSFISCENSFDSQVDTVLNPLSVGNYWKYKIYRYSSEKIVPGLTDSLLVTIDEEITVNIEGNTYKGGVQTRRFGASYYEEVKWIFANLNGGLYFLGGIAKKDSIYQKFLYLKYPARAGEKWETPYVYYSFGSERFGSKPDNNTRYTCVSAKQKFSTETGVFDCIVYHYREKPAPDISGYWEYFLYYSPGIGFIGAEVRGSDGNMLISKVILTGYRIK